MDDALSLFDDGEPPLTTSSSTISTVTPSQREALRKSFAALGVLDARGQFALVAELTGQQITSVLQLEETHAQTLIHRLAAKVNSLGRKNTGNAWDDRDEDTWIDKL